MKTIVLVACASKKADIPMPAKDLYQSTWFRYARQYAELVGDSWYILSAKYGLVHPDEVLYPYEYRLARNEIDWWARDVLLHFPPGVSGHKVVFLAGKRYRERLGELLRHVGAIVEAPMAGLGIGQQVAWLKAQVETLKGETHR